jgi:hypothetical protein
MGRSQPTYRGLLEELETAWTTFRAGIRDERKKRAFDAVFQRARAHAAAGTNQGWLNPMETLLVSVAIEQEAELQDVRRQLDQLAERLNHVAPESG